MSLEPLTKSVFIYGTAQCSKLQVDSEMESMSLEPPTKTTMLFVD